MRLFSFVGEASVNVLRSLRLVAIHNKQFFLKLRYDLGRELVVLISSLVLLGLFVYIFRDFLTEKLKVIPPEAQAGIAQSFALILLMLTGLAFASPIYKLWRDEPTLRSLAYRSGEEPGVIRNFLLIQTLSIFVLYFGAYWSLVGLRFGNWSLITACLLQGASILFAGGRFLFFGIRKPKEDAFKPLLDDRQNTRRRTMTSWRIKQITLRNRLARLCLALSLVISAASAVFLFSGTPFALSVLLSMASGLLVAAALSFQLEEDMRAIWFEKQIASSHEEYVAAYQSISLSLGLALAGFITVLCLPALLSLSLSDALKLGVIAAIFPAIFPAVMFQIAPERPILQIMTIALIGLFLGTAVFAHWASLIILPIAIVYAKQYQSNNFYRS